jgi:RimJ/RimL family protein N-acetyltransferase
MSEAIITIRSAEPTDAAIDLADNWLNLHRLELEVYVDNEAAI